MAIFRLSSYPAQTSPGAQNDVQVMITQRGALRSRTVEASSLQDAMAALDKYYGEARALGEPMAVTIGLLDGRSPPGFKRAMQDAPFVPVNCGTDILEGGA